ncbi:MAG: hypothetical protein ACK5DD_01515 [Cyclobacteriaceae bacterium]|jgi:hypothetical protein
MKTRVGALVVTLLLTVMSAQATDCTKTKFAYWVLENNAIVKGSSLIKLYDSRNQLVQEIRLQGIYLDLSQKKHRKLLEKKLREAGEQDVWAARRNLISWS